MRVVVGRIGRPHGIRGEVSVEPRTDDPDGRFAAGSRLFTGETGSEGLVVDARRWHSGRLLIRFEGIADRTDAESLRGTRLYGEPSPGVEDDAWYDHELIGLAVRVEGSQVGAVTDVIHLPAQDLLEVEVPGGRRLVPLVAELVPRVDVGGGFVEVANVPGLLTDQEG